ncbi:N-acetyltransferase [Paenibacillus thermoaerophilus]|jgi:amino-acid N-acetyltransferase|uniref:N-acetyltransferase n=1 Tax=Paenibacillus thermoaerophilus TaxID=1215385 RepID=A0ABW2UZR5_9BACL|nr:N-acetyltransferase [Paenibacillus thermoaerophilus]TMV18991.1 N-acetyltransferase [Paenibacillus thermoaerophilus]
MVTTVTCRKAAESDVDSLYELIQGYAEKGIMLPRSKEALTRHIDSFVVAEEGGRFVGCGSLFRLGNDLVEIRSLGITDGYKGKGIGGLIVKALEEEAREMGIPRVMALTYAVNFFLRCGYEVVQKEIFPEKVWTDCVNCKKRNNCDEIAVLKRLDA